MHQSSCYNMRCCNLPGCSVIFTSCEQIVSFEKIMRSYCSYSHCLYNKTFPNKCFHKRFFYNPADLKWKIKRYDIHTKFWTFATFFLKYGVEDYPMVYTISIEFWSRCVIHFPVETYVVRSNRHMLVCT